MPKRPWLWVRVLAVFAWIGYIWVLGPFLLTQESWFDVAFGIVLLLLLFIASSVLVVKYLDEYTPEHLSNKR